jgi:hypothetical protein
LFTGENHEEPDKALQRTRHARRWAWALGSIELNGSAYSTLRLIDPDTAIQWPNQSA